MKKLALLSAAVVATVAAGANAAVLEISTGPVAAYNNTAEFSPRPFNPSLNPATTGVVYEIPVNFQLSGLGAGESFGNISFDVIISGSGVPDPLGYSPNTEGYTSGKQTVPYFSINQDAGSNTTDLKDIVASIPGGTPSPQRAAMGVGAAFPIGYIYMQLPNGVSNNATVTVQATGYSLSINGTLTNQPDNTITQAPAVTFVIPEPATLGLAGLGGLAVVARRRRA